MADTRTAVNGIETVQSVTTLKRLGTGDLISLTGIQASGGSLSTTVFTGRAARLSLQWMGP